MISTLYNQNQLNVTDESKSEQAQGQNQQNTFDYSRIDYNKYIDSIYSKDKKKNNQQRTSAYYDKNAVNENVNAYYESFYGEVAPKEPQNIETGQQVQNSDNQIKIDSSVQEASKQEEFKVPFGLGFSGGERKERKRKSRFDDNVETNEQISNVSNNVNPELINLNSNFAIPK
jgi:hypothetical protein